jgi:tRNA pseudouridine38-40 synthase
VRDTRRASGSKDGIIRAPDPTGEPEHAPSHVSSPVPRYRLTLMYDGTNYCGWQKQEPPDPAVPASDLPEGAPRPRVILPTVQHVVEQGVREVVREPVILMGASRTDAGVHAAGQVAAFTTSDGDDRSRGWPVDRGTDALCRAINSRLPEDVNVVGAAIAPDDFDPIHDAVCKAYSYSLHVSRHRPAWDRRYVHHVWSPLDVDAMNAAAAVLVGEHDFAGFAAAGHGRLTTVRTVFGCRVVKTDGPPDGARAREGSLESMVPTKIRIDVVGSGFLWNMVRIIAGTLVEAGMGKSDPQRVKKALETGDRRMAGPTLPAQGLRLEWIRYRGEVGPA